jgi:DNA modification methylase
MIELHNGDCLDILRHIPDSTIDAIITDPPYGMDYQSSWRIGAQRKRKIANDKRPFIWWMNEAYRILGDDTAIYCFTDWCNSEAFRTALELAGFVVRSQGIWDRGAHGMGDLRSQLAPQHDVIWFATKGKFKFPGSRPKSIFRSMRIDGSVMVHPNEKPVDLMGQLITSITTPGQTVLDPFMGAGSTGVAALELNRQFVGVEMDTTYFEIASKRISDAQKQASVPAA